MRRTVPRVLFVMGVVAAATTAGCAVDKAQPCKNIQQEIQNLLRNGVQQINDPQALIKTLRESAARIRKEGDPVGGDVERASDEAGTALEHLADRLAEGPPQQSDLDPLLQAGTKIGSACA